VTIRQKAEWLQLLGKYREIRRNKFSHVPKRLITVESTSSIQVHITTCNLTYGRILQLTQNSLIKIKSTAKEDNPVYSKQIIDRDIWNP
jgi:hypothetical protein